MPYRLSFEWKWIFKRIWFWVAACGIVAAACFRYFLTGRLEGEEEGRTEKDLEGVDAMEKKGDSKGLREDILRRLK